MLNVANNNNNNNDKRNCSEDKKLDAKNVLFLAKKLFGVYNYFFDYEMITSFVRLRTRPRLRLRATIYFFSSEDGRKEMRHSEDNLWEKIISD